MVADELRVVFRVNNSRGFPDRDQDVGKAKKTTKCDVVWFDQSVYW